MAAACGSTERREFAEPSALPFSVTVPPEMEETPKPFLPSSPATVPMTTESMSVAVPLTSASTPMSYPLHDAASCRDRMFERMLAG